VPDYRYQKWPVVYFEVATDNRFGVYVPLGHQEVGPRARELLHHGDTAGIGAKLASEHHGADCRADR
jgi:hypothetical protein